MPLVRVWGRIGQKIGARTLLTFAYSMTGRSAFWLRPPLLQERRWLAWHCCAWRRLSATIIDGAGNVPFLRAVHHHERPEMTSVFMDLPSRRRAVRPLAC